MMKINLVYFCGKEKCSLTGTERFDRSLEGRQ